MTFTEQQQVLDEMRRRYGKTAFTEDRIAYKRVGYERGGKLVDGIGATWDEAVETLGKKDRK